MIEGNPKTATALLCAAALLSTATLLACTISPQTAVVPDTAHHTYLGFDRNSYPGDAALPILRKTFAFTSYWISPPPGEKTNTWLGQRALALDSGGFWEGLTARSDDLGLRSPGSM